MIPPLMAGLVNHSVSYSCLIDLCFNLLFVYFTGVTIHFAFVVA